LNFYHKMIHGVRLSLSVCLLFFVVVFAGFGCDEGCKTSADCKAGEVCTSGKCRTVTVVVDPDPDPQPDAGADTDAGGDGDTDSDVDSGPVPVPDAGNDADAGYDAGQDAGPDCGSKCVQELYTACTCDASDPCGWVENGTCDTAGCAPFAGWGPVFDDARDCAGANCGGDCLKGMYTLCTCLPSDPCMRQENLNCDHPSCLEVDGIDEIFNDWVDCDGPCGGDCGTTLGGAVYTLCTCDWTDPCGWVGDCFCHGGFEGPCEGIPGLTQAFPDKADCETPCPAEDAGPSDGGSQ
jgi:hypothetical protein